MKVNGRLKNINISFGSNLSFFRLLDLRAYDKVRHSNGLDSGSNCLEVA